MRTNFLLIDIRGFFFFFWLKLILVELDLHKIKFCVKFLFHIRKLSSTWVKQSHISHYDVGPIHIKLDFGKVKMQEKLNFTNVELEKKGICP